MKYISIPRLELIAATSSVKVSLLLRRWESPLTRNIFGQIPRLFWETTTTTAKNVRYLLQTGFNSSEKMQIQSNASMCQPSKIQQMTVPED